MALVTADTQRFPGWPLRVARSPSGSTPTRRWSSSTPTRGHRSGIITRRDALLDDEVLILDGRAVTTPERTAFDIGRRGSISSAVARLDALANATGFKIDDVARVASRHRGARGLRHLETVLELVDGGAQSPKESQVRLWLIEAGFPRPQTQIPVFGPDGVPFAFLDLGWEEWMLGVSMTASTIRQPVSDRK